MSFGPWLARCRNAQLVHLIGARHALLLGDGDGRFLARLLEANSTVTADVVDSSRSMLAILERRVRRSGPQARRRICLHRADALEWNPTGRYDLIVSHFFLDCFSTQQLEQLFDAVLPHALPGVQWVISEFAIPRNALAAYLARRIIRLLYQVFGWTTGLPVRALPDYGTGLFRRGLVLSHERRYLAGLLCTQVWRLPASSRQTTLSMMKREPREIGNHRGIVGELGMCQSFYMDKDRIIGILQEHAPELKAAGLAHLRVFGSVARGEASPQSDVDLMADFDKSKRITLLTVGRLESRLGDLLGVKVDLSAADWMKEPVRRQALRESVLAF
jgi:predicted nucleotidyltransferase